MSATDSDSAPAQLTYTIEALPLHGIVKLDGVTLAVGRTFTQADVAAGRLSYTHDGGETTTDSVRFSLTDGTTTLTGRTLPLQPVMGPAVA